MVDLDSALEAQISQGENQQLPLFTSPQSAGNFQSHASIIHTHAKLPKLELRKFHGNPNKWYPFWECFNDVDLISFARFQAGMPQQR